MITSVHPYALYVGLPIIALAAIWYWFKYKNPVYVFSSLVPLKALATSTKWRRLCLFLLRLLTLSSLCLAIARFQAPDERSKIPVEGVDIMIVLDTSESMLIQDDEGSKKSRIDAAKEEALKFIDKRDNDPIGLVIFSGAAVSRCPLTLDKRVLKEILQQSDTSTIQAPGTVLSRAILTAANRLKKSTAKSRIMIVLTDGEPTPNDVDPSLAIDMAKKLGIKIYTIGIGSEKPLYVDHPIFGRIPVQATLNVALLERFAHETGGQFFRARNTAEMEQIYDTIDKLERTEHETPIFARYFEYFMPFLWIALLFLCFEIPLTSWVWIRL